MDARPGTYTVIYENRRTDVVRVGRRLRVALEPGYYLYVGSAFGPGGVRARVLRHCRRDKPRHWHIDFLRPFLIPLEAWYTHAREPLEHRWARDALGRSGTAPVPGFGCSDCRCPAHLFHTRDRPDFLRFRRSAAVPVGRWAVRRTPPTRKATL